jgi:hypothetical protein
MVVKKKVKKRVSGYQKVEKVIENDIEEVDKFITERRKFLRKLGMVVVLILILILLAYLIFR